ncbi:von Willebrand factor type D domain-containing protein [Nitrosomonas marina]|uniref:von Willebrand factor type D domain-containing protein n=1 Tax=Nitrosomonas marina TaxID=917 RepID=A0A1I0FSW2_9PROT|nr:Ig-like domain-containing protein [Nitrosomonas marina]SET60723.1 von Willebrand factor type D domain-containing protein [Nitrosomonas marina]
MLQNKLMTKNAQKLLIIDADVLDADILLKGCKPDYQIIRLDPKSEPITQLTNAIHQHAPVQEIALVAHGSPGRIHFTNFELNLVELEKHKSVIAGWQSFFTKDAKFCFYVCKLAAGKAGKTFLSKLNKFTDVTIAAATSILGNLGKKQNWDLDFFTYPFEVLLPFSESTIEDYPYALAPTLSFSIPFDDSTHQIDNDIQLLFDVTVVAGIGSIIISNGSDTRTIDVNDTSQVTINGGIVTINPATDLVPNTTYNIQMASGVITDTAGNAYAGISNPTTLDFTTIPPADPMLDYSDPLDGGTHQIDNDIRLTFNEQVVAGTGAIILSNGTDTRTIDINDAGQVTFDDFGNVIINPAADLVLNTTYNIQMASGVITDIVGNAYAGISDSTTLNFRTISTVPLLDFSSPFDGSTHQIDNDIRLFFNETVVAGIGNIIISNGSDTRTIDVNDTSQVTINGSVVTINPAADLVLNTTYNIQMASGVITDTAGNAYAGINDSTTLNFTTIPTDPLFFSSLPFNGSTHQVDDEIQLFFNETVVPGIGNIIISNGSDTRTINVSDTSQVTFDDFGSVSFGSVTINPTSDLAPNTTYNIQMASGVITDTAGNAYAGIKGPIMLNFTTISTEPLLDYSDPRDDSTHQIDRDIELRFNETVIAGSGNIIISNGPDTRTININDTSQVKIDDGVVTINPTADLILNTTYNIQMASGVITDSAGNAYAGISDPTTLNFTTIPSDPLLSFSDPFNGDTHQIDNDIRLTFNEQVVAGTGAIILSNGSDTRTIDVNDASQVTFDDFRSVTINPATDLEPNTTYNIQMVSGVITDTAGNAYAGISDPTTLNFTTIPTDPLLSFSDPFNGSTHQIDHDIELFFNETVVAGSGNIIISNGSDTRTIDVTDTSQITFSDFSGIITINPTTDLEPNTTYNIQMASGVITDTSGNAYAGISDPTALNFTTIEGIHLINGVGGVADFGEQVLSGNDDNSTDYIDLSSIFEGGINFFGQVFTGIWINNNGSVTFNGPREDFIPAPLSVASGNPEITPFFADIDTRGGVAMPTGSGNSTGSNLVYYDSDVANDRFIVTWDDVGYFGAHTDKLNAFQLILTDQGSGDFDIEFRYEDMNWTTGDSGEGADGFGGMVARAGFSSGTGDPAEFFELPASGQNAMLALDETIGNTGEIGRWLFNFRSGDIVNTASCSSVARGASDGDPHLRTFDGLSYDFQAAGEFTIVRGSGPDLEMQVRQEPWGSRTDVSVNTAVAMRVGNDVVGIYTGQPNPVNINGVFVAIAPGETVPVDGGTVHRDGNAYTVTNEHGDGFWARVGSGAINLRTFICADRDSVAGLLGNNDGDHTNDIALADGTQLSSSPTAGDLYGQFADSWRVTTDTTLFIYNAGESTETFTDRNFPSHIISINDLDPAIRAAAEDIARSIGLPEGTVEFNNAVLDIALTGNEEFGQIALEAMLFEIPQGSVGLFAGSDVSIAEGDIFSRTVSFLDSEDTNTDGWTYSIDWDDGSPVENGTIAAGLNSFDISRTFADGDASHTVSVTVTDDTGDSDTQLFVLAVNNVAPTLALSGDASVDEGATYTLTLGTITDPGDDTITSYIVNWGDGSSNTYTTAGDVTHVYNTAGNKTISVDLVDEDGTHTDAGSLDLKINTCLRINGASDGDPHLRTFDGLSYDFQAAGEFTIVRGSDSSLEMQVRQEPWGSRTDVSVNTAVAMRVGNDVVGIYAGQPNPVNINGVFVAIAPGETVPVDGGTVHRDGNAYTVTNEHGDGFWARVASTTPFLNLRPFICADLGDTVSGLLGNYDGDRSNDIALADGTQLSSSPTAGDLYGQFADSWRVTTDTTLFIYNAGESTETFTDRNFPSHIISINDLDPAIRAAAEQTARSIGFPENTVEFDNAVLDIALTGNIEFGELALEALLFDIPPGSVGLNVGADVSIAEGDTFNRTITFIDTEDADGDGWTYNIDWNDNSPVENGTIPAGSNSFDISHSFVDGIASHNVSVSIIDLADDSDTRVFTLDVDNVEPTISVSGAPQVDVGATYTFNLGTVTDPGDDTVTDYIVDWGDGTSDTFNTAGDVMHTYAAAGDNTITVDLVDEDGTHVNAGSLSVLVNSAPDGVAVSAGNDTAISEGGTFVRTITFTDGEDTGGDGWTYSVDFGDGSELETGSIVAGANSFDISHEFADGDASHNVSVTVTDTVGDTDTKQFAVNVFNVIPTITVTGEPQVNTGNTYILNLSAVVDPGNDTVTDFIVNWGDGTTDTFNASGDVTHVYGSPGSNTISVLLKDEDGTHAAVGNFNVQVIDPIAGVSVDAGPNSIINEGEPFLRTITFTDGEDANLDGWTYSIDWGDGSAIEPGSIANGADAFGINHIFADGAASHTVSVTVTDTAGDSDTQQFILEVNNVVPTIALGGASEVNIGDSYTLNLGSITDPGNDTVTSYVVYWGDGTSSTFNTAGDVTHVYNSTGNGTISVDLVDEDGTHTDAGTLNVLVNAAPDGIAVNAGTDTVIDEGGTFNRTITFTDGQDTDADGWTFSVNWGDGSTIENGVIAAGANNFDISRVFADGDASHTVSVTITDTTGDSDTQQFTLDVNNVAPTVDLPGNDNVNEGENYTLSLVNLVDPGDDTVTDYIINWGDGTAATTLTAAELLAAGNNVNHVFTDGASSPQVTVDLVDEDGTHVSAGSKTIIVNNVAPTIALIGNASVDEGSTYTLTGNVFDPGTDTITDYIINWGDGTTTALTAAELQTLSGNVTHVYADGASNPLISVDLVDEDGTHSAAGTLNVAVNNVAPIIALSGASEINTNDTYTLNLGAITDPGDDNVTGYIVNWGDGSSDTYSSAGDVTHTYAAAGDNTITVDLIDEDGTHVNAATLDVTANPTVPTETILIGDAPLRVSRSDPNAWENAWTVEAVSISHKANYLDTTEAWSSASLNGRNSNVLNGGDIFGGDLGVSGQSLASSSIRQEIDGKEALRFDLDQAATKVTIDLSRLDGNSSTGHFDAGRLQLLDDSGSVINELIFSADAASHEKQITLDHSAGFSSVVLTAGSYNGIDFVFGGLTDETGQFLSDPQDLGNDVWNTSEYLVDAVEFEFGEITLVGSVA